MAFRVNAYDAYDSLFEYIQNLIDEGKRLYDCSSRYYFGDNNDNIESNKNNNTDNNSNNDECEYNINKMINIFYITQSPVDTASFFVGHGDLADHDNDDDDAVTLF